ncbi:polysaccharide biosynthesis/export family protein [Methylobacterium sp. P5_C11]
MTQTGSIQEGLPATVVAAAQEEAGRTMRLGLANYRLNVGDNFEVSFLIDSSVVQPTYRLNPNDEFDVDFRTHPEFNRSVIVRPDGRISLPGKNGIKVAGLSPEAAARGATVMKVGALSSTVASLSRLPSGATLPRKGRRGSRGASAFRWRRATVQTLQERRRPHPPGSTWKAAFFGARLSVKSRGVRA